MKRFNPLDLDSTGSEERRGRSREECEGGRRNWKGRQKERNGSRERVTGKIKGRESRRRGSKRGRMGSEREQEVLSKREKGKDEHRRDLCEGHRMECDGTVLLQCY